MPENDTATEYDALNAENAHDTQLAEYLRRIGAKSLAAELDDLRFRNRIIEARRWQDFHEARISYEEQLHDKLDQRLMSNQAVLYDKSQSYMNFVVTLGYAGFFTIWNFIKGSMHEWDMKLVALLLGASLLAFIFWTLLSMTVGGQAVDRIGKALRTTLDDREAMLEAVMEAEKVNLSYGLTLQRLWLPTFAFTIVTGFAGGVILLALLVADVLGCSFSLYSILQPLEA